MGILTYLNPNVIKDSSIGGTKLNDNSISSSKIDGTVASKSYVDDQVKTVDDKVTALEPRVTNAVQITYTELKSLRDAGKLVPGTQYHITDYTCTTIQPNTQSAGHQFDIIVTADDESTLNEVARAVKHDGDAYFANSELSAWQIWYCLDNDTNRFAWADGTNGKGVIYRMIDEQNNDVPYDFKNIQFKHPKDTTTYPYYYYTFASDNTEDNTDYSLSIANNCYSNTIREYINGNKRLLNCIIFIGYNSRGYGTICNTFSTNCYDNTFGEHCNGNYFGDGCHDNTFGDNCVNNTFGEDCFNNTLGDRCGRNTLGAYCYSNTLGAGCSNNTFGQECENNTVGVYCCNNTFGHFCRMIKFASDRSASFKYAFYENNHFGNGCEYIIFTGAEIASEFDLVRNYNFANGLRGTDAAYLIIDGVRNRDFETKIEKASNGILKEYCLGDFIYNEDDYSYSYSASFIGEI